MRWSLDDVMAGGAGLDAKAFPAMLDFAAHRYRLEYRFMPGDEADGGLDGVDDLGDQPGRPVHRLRAGGSGH